MASMCPSTTDFENELRWNASFGMYVTAAPALVSAYGLPRFFPEQCPTSVETVSPEEWLGFFSAGGIAFANAGCAYENNGVLYLTILAGDEMRMPVDLGLLGRSTRLDQGTFQELASAGGPTLVVACNDSIVERVLPLLDKIASKATAEQIAAERICQPPYNTQEDEAI